MHLSYHSGLVGLVSGKPYASYINVTWHLPCTTLPTGVYNLFLMYGISVPKYGISVRTYGISVPTYGISVPTHVTSVPTYVTSVPTYGISAPTHGTGVP